VPTAQTARRNANPDADGKAPFGGRYHLAWVAWHHIIHFLFYKTFAHDLCDVQPHGPEHSRCYLPPMRCRVRLSSDVSEI